MKSAEEFYVEVHSIKESKSSKSRLNRQRFRWFAQEIKKKNCRKILDVGAHLADFHTFLQSGVDYTVLDVSPAVVEQLKKDGISAILGNLQESPFPDKTFDCIILGEVIEHLFNVGQCLAEINRILKNDGLFLGSTPNGHLPYRLFRAAASMFSLRRRFRKRKPGKKKAQHVNLYLCQILKTMFEIYDFRITAWKTVNESRIGLVLCKIHPHFTQKLVWKARKTVQ